MSSATTPALMILALEPLVKHWLVDCRGLVSVGEVAQLACLSRAFRDALCTKNAQTTECVWRQVLRLKKVGTPLQLGKKMTCKTRCFVCGARTTCMPCTRVSSCGEKSTMTLCSGCGSFKGRAKKLVTFEEAKAMWMAASNNGYTGGWRLRERVMDAAIGRLKAVQRLKVAKRKPKGGAYLYWTDQVQALIDTWRQTL